MVGERSVRARDDRQSTAFWRARGRNNGGPRIDARVGNSHMRATRFFLREWDNAISKNAATRWVGLTATPLHARRQSSALPHRHRQRNKCLYTRWRRPECSLSRRSPGSSSVCQRCRSDEREVSGGRSYARVSYDPTRPNPTDRCGAVRYGTTRRGAAWRGAARHGTARHDGVRCSAVRSGAGQCTA